MVRGAQEAAGRVWREKSRSALGLDPSRGDFVPPHFKVTILVLEAMQGLPTWGCSVHRPPCSTHTDHSRAISEGKAAPSLLAIVSPSIGSRPAVLVYFLRLPLISTQSSATHVKSGIASPFLPANSVLPSQALLLHKEIHL